MNHTLATWGMGAILASSLLSPNAAAQAGFTPISFKNASVHDPSVVRTNDGWYVFGSHLAAARSADLMNWQQIASGVSAANPLFMNGSANVLTELAETFSWAQSDTLWAADVKQLADGKFYMYYNACKGDAPFFQT
jgi:arabinan endo-1,5-alpha-L-arabinosidase